MGRHACLKGETVASTPRNSANKRIYLLGAILLFWAGVICLRLVYLQIFRYGDFEQRAQHQQQRTTEVAAKRGVIYDRAGRELAMSIAVDSAFAVPAEIPDLAGTISLVSRITKADPREMLARCKAARTFCWVARKLGLQSPQAGQVMHMDATLPDSATPELASVRPDSMISAR